MSAKIPDELKTHMLETIRSFVPAAYYLCSESEQRTQELFHRIYKTSDAIDGFVTDPKHLLTAAYLRRLYTNPDASRISIINSNPELLQKYQKKMSKTTKIYIEVLEEGKVHRPPSFMEVDTPAPSPALESSSSAGIARHKLFPPYPPRGSRTKGTA